MLYQNTALYNKIKELNVIDSKSLESCLKEAESQNLPLDVILTKKDLIKDNDVGRLISELISFPYVTIKDESIPKDILNIIPEIVAKKQSAVLFDKNKEGLKLATTNPLNNEFFDMIRKKTGEFLSIYYTTEKNIQEALSLYNEPLQKAYESLLITHIKNSEKDKNTEVPVSKIVDTLVQYAYQNKASDIHIEPKDNASTIRFRIDGVLHEVLSIPLELHEKITSRIKVMSKLRTDEHMSAQDGKLNVALQMENLDIRVSIVPIVKGEKIVLRLLSSNSRQFSLQDLGMDEEDLQKVQKAYKRPNGMVLATGPTGSGKTTTIYSILKIINSKEVNIATIEDPVEYDIEGINQIQVNPKTNLTFSSGLRAILRQDPDVIFVGEIRDQDTAGIAVNSAMTGHLVLSTLHTNDAVTTLPRLTDMGIEPFLVASTVNVIIAQRLVRKICSDCRVSEEIKREQLIDMISEEKIKKYFGENAQIRVYEGKGCEYCHNSGYVGRVGIFEVLEITDELKKLIAQKSSSGELKSVAITLGMETMFENGLRKVAQGLTTLEELYRVTEVDK